MVNLQAILDENEVVLVDSSMISPRKFTIGWDIYGVHNYSKLDFKKLKYLEEWLCSTLKTLKHKSIATIPAVTKEAKGLNKILNDKLKFLDSHRTRSHTNRYKGEKKRFNIKHERENEGEELLKQVQDHVYSITTTLKKKELRVNDYRYDILLNMVKLLDQTIGLVRYTHEHQNTPGETVEKLSAMVYYLSVEREESVLLTDNTNFVRLLGVATKLLGSDTFLPYNADFRKAFHEHPFKLYIMEDTLDSFDASVNSSKEEYDKKFTIHNITLEKNKEVQQIMMQHWKDFKEFS